MYSCAKSGNQPQEGNIGSLRKQQVLLLHIAWGRVQHLHVRSGRWYSTLLSSEGFLRAVDWRKEVHRASFIMKLWWWVSGGHLVEQGLGEVWNVIHISHSFINIQPGHHPMSIAACQWCASAHVISWGNLQENQWANCSTVAVEAWVSKYRIKEGDIQWQSWAAWCSCIPEEVYWPYVNG